MSHTTYPPYPPSANLGWNVVKEDIMIDRYFPTMGSFSRHYRNPDNITSGGSDTLNTGLMSLRADPPNGQSTSGSNSMINEKLIRTKLL